ncbi:MAG TPA: transglycosylase SLT domain-containing protein [Amycolatopsis sp.]|jgi:hypothetical protein|nr:transglycosylase SLT domain-containing protein [Amycolatopsis sp.]
MSTLTAEQIAQSAYKAGFRGDALTTATAVALAESSGNPDAHNDTGKDNSYGLWQINMFGDNGPDRREKFDLGSNDDLFKPDENARAAYALADHGKNFVPWTTYTDGAYKKHLDAARKAAEKVSADHGKSEPPKKPGDHGGGNGGGGAGGGFTVDAQALADYTRKTDRVADELGSVGSRTVHTVTGIAADSFGEVGKETGFADALGDFSRALEKQVRAIGTQARNLGDATGKIAKAYQDNEDDVSKDLRALDIKSVLG